LDGFKRHKWVYEAAINLFGWIFALKLNFKGESLRKLKAPYLLLVNHTLDLDPVLVAYSSRRHMYFVASEHIMRKGFWTKVLMYLFHPIIHQKGKAGIKTVKEIMSSLKKGRSVCLFPEGNRSFNGITGPIANSAGNLARSVGVPVVTYRIEGGYLTQPRWSTTMRRGKVSGRIVHVYTPEELKAMTPAEANSAIVRDLQENAYETQSQRQIRFKGKNLALGLDSALFICPKCGRLTLRSDDTSVFCECGWRASYDELGMLTDDKGEKFTVTELDRKQRAALKEIVSSADESSPIFSDTVRLQTMGSNHDIAEEKEGTLTAYKDRLECCGRVFPLAELDGFAIYARNSLILNCSHLGMFEVKSGTEFCGLKYIYLYKIVKGEI